MTIKQSPPKDAAEKGFPNLSNGLSELSKSQRQHGERLAAVLLDQSALNLLNALDRETSIRWENLLDRVGSDWSDASRAAALLAGAHLCEAGPNRIRLSEYADRLLAEPTPIEPLSLEEARSLRGTGWQGDLDEMRFSRVL